MYFTYFFYSYKSPSISGSVWHSSLELSVNEWQPVCVCVGLDISVSSGLQGPSHTIKCNDSTIIRGQKWRVLLERLGQVEALLHVVVVWRWSVDISDAAVASVDSTVLLQGLNERRWWRRTARRERETKKAIGDWWHKSLNLREDYSLNHEWPCVRFFCFCFYRQFMDF